MRQQELDSGKYLNCEKKKKADFRSQPFKLLENRMIGGLHLNHWFPIVRSTTNCKIAQP